MNTDELIEKVKEWGAAKGITGLHGEGNLLAQLSKTQEELTETRDAAVRWMAAPKRFVEDWEESIYPDFKLDEIQDGIGDCTVTLILAAELAGLRFEDCLVHAYHAIKSRTGTMIGGQFVKDK